MGPTAGEPKIYGYSVSGIKEDEKLTNGETRKVFISTRVPYTVDKGQVLVDNLQYRVICDSRYHSSRGSSLDRRLICHLQVIISY